MVTLSYYTPIAIANLAVAVNSRCIYFDVGDSSASSADNLTLGPIIDMMNHQSGRLSKPIQKSDTLSFSMPAFGSPDSQFAVGSELVFSYGGHEWCVISRCISAQRTDSTSKVRCCWRNTVSRSLPQATAIAETPTIICRSISRLLRSSLRTRTALRSRSCSRTTDIGGELE